MFDAPEPIRYHITSSSGIGLIFNGTYMVMFTYISLPNFTDYQLH